MEFFFYHSNDKNEIKKIVQLNSEDLALLIPKMDPLRPSKMGNADVKQAPLSLLTPLFLQVNMLL